MERTELHFKKKIKTMVLNLGIGEVAIAATSVTDFLAVSMLGIETIAGYSFAVSFIFLIYTINSINDKVVMPLYAKNRDIPEVFSYTLMSEVLLAIFLTTLCIAAPTIIDGTNLSDKAKSIVMPVIIVRGIGSFVYTTTCSLYIYLRANNYEKESGRGRIYCAVTNIAFDFIAIVFNTGVVGVALATTISELVELVYIVYVLSYRLKKRIHKRHLKLKKIDIRNYISETINTSVLKIMEFISTYLVTCLGDTGYAIYSLLYTLSDLVCYFVYSYQVITTVIYSEFSNRISNFYLKLQKEFTKSSLLWWVVSCPLTIGVVKILTIENGLKLNLIVVCIMNLLFILFYQIGDYSIGVMRIHKMYSNIIVLHIVASIVLLISEIILLKITKNPYIIISAWYLYWTVKSVYLFSYSKRETVKLENKLRHSYDN